MNNPEITPHITILVLPSGRAVVVHGKLTADEIAQAQTPEGAASIEAYCDSLEQFAKFGKKLVHTHCSCAEWPSYTFGQNESGFVTKDKHYSAASAQAVCKLLESRSAGGEGKVFPLRTWVEPIEPAPEKPDEEKTEEELRAEVFNPEVSDYEYFLSRRQAMMEREQNGRN